MSREPRPGEVSHLPGTWFLTCPLCGTTSTLFQPNQPTTLTCTGCSTDWIIETLDASWRWTIRNAKETSNADAPAS